ncbi:MAG TPA: IS30 family transposase, partial [Acidimicrobiales bacterium]|nr:IS30 family transposase [Acidimicrobiales bacterium]
MPGKRLAFEERTEICRRLARGESLRCIAAALSRPPSTISREVGRNGGSQRYRPIAAHQRAERESRRPKAFKLERHGRLRRLIEAKLWAKWSPDQIAGWLRREHPNDPRWWVSAQTIYESLYVQGRGVLRAELVTKLRRHRTKERRQSTFDPYRDALKIADRPPEADDRRVPGHWEGDLLVGKAQKSCIAVLVERTTRYTILVAVDDKTTDVVVPAITEAIKDLPAHLRRSLTWDQGRELARYKDFAVAADTQVYFCDPASPWQRGTNENTNGLLRQYFPKREFDFNTVTQD